MSSREQKLEAALRRTEGDLLRYGRHDSDCPAREYVLVDGIPTTCDCGLNVALDVARLAVLGEQEATPPEPQHRVTFTVGPDGCGVRMLGCPFDDSDTARPCWPHDESGAPMPAPQSDCTYESWVEAVGLECFAESEFDASVVVAEFSDDGPVFDVGDLLPASAPQGEGEPTQEELLMDDLLRCMEVRNLALEEAALYVQPGPDGQDYLDRRQLIHMWVAAAHERHDDGERAASAHIDGGPPPSLAQWAAPQGEGNTDE